MNFSVGGFFATSLVSGAGMVFFVYGKKKGDALFMIFGVIMVAFPMFIGDFWTVMGIGGAMCGLLYWLKKR